MGSKALRKKKEYVPAHTTLCSVHRFSGDRKCTCGRDKYLRDVETLKDVARAYWKLHKKKEAK